MSKSTLPWIDSLHTELDTLEAALLHGEPTQVQTASAQVQAVLRAAPPTSAFGEPGSSQRLDMQMAAQRFGQLRQAVMRASAQSQRAVSSLLPQHTPATYGRSTGAASLRGAGQAYLAA
ncbi:hypothetical protein [Hydrogenophaga sp.]|uniref:hypothetical protein n=1 Tax=Hydrogenophaga sp. TaxID=1904254 RepID=UPI003563C467